MHVSLVPAPVIAHALGPANPCRKCAAASQGVGSGASYSRRKASQFRVGALAFFRGRMTTDPRHRRVHESSYDDDVFEHERSRYFARPAEGVSLQGVRTPSPLESREFNNSISSTVAASPSATSKSFAARLVATGVFAFAGIFTPLVATAASPSQPGIVKSSVSDINPNVIRLPDSTRARLDAFFLERVQDCKGVIEAVDRHINDPWDIEDIWLIFLWHFMITKGRRKAYKFSRDSFAGSPDASGSWETSFWNWAAHPMRVVGALWIALYAFDNAVRIGSMLGIARWLPLIMMEQFDRGMYTLAGGIIAIMMTDRWFPEILESRANVKDASQRLVLTRLVTVSLAITTVVCTAIVFGLPPKSLLGFGGIGGLTFGLAAKDLISNFLGGSMLAVMRPFSPGEKVYLMAVGGRFRGTNEPSVGGYLVKDIGWYATTLIPKDTRPTTVPNGFFLGANVINISRQTARIMVMNIRVRLDDLPTIPVMTSEIEEYLHDHPAVTNPPERPIRVHLRDVLPDHAAVRVEAHTHIVKKEAFLAVNQEVTLGVYAIVGKFASGPAWPVGCYDGAAGKWGAGNNQGSNASFDGTGR